MTAFSRCIRCLKTLFQTFSSSISVVRSPTTMSSCSVQRIIVSSFRFCIVSGFSVITWSTFFITSKSFLIIPSTFIIVRIIIRPIIVTRICPFITTFVSPILFLIVIRILLRLIFRKTSSVSLRFFFVFYTISTSWRIVTRFSFTVFS